jgi:hypothetical protein
MIECICKVEIEIFKWRKIKMKTIKIYKFSELNENAQKNALTNVVRSTPYAFYAEEEIDKKMGMKFNEIITSGLLQKKFVLEFKRGEGVKFSATEVISGLALYDLMWAYDEDNHVSPTKKRFIDRDLFGIHFEDTDNDTINVNVVNVWAEHDDNLNNYPKIADYIWQIAGEIQEWYFDVCYDLEQYMERLYSEYYGWERVREYIEKLDTEEKYFENGSLKDW